MIRHPLALTLSLLVGTALTSVTTAQEITDTPGSPGATTTIDGRYLPPSPRVKGPLLTRRK